GPVFVPDRDAGRPAVFEHVRLMCNNPIASATVSVEDQRVSGGRGRAGGNRRPRSGVRGAATTAAVFLASGTAALTGSAPAPADSEDLFSLDPIIAALGQAAVVSDPGLPDSPAAGLAADLAIPALTATDSPALSQLGTDLMTWSSVVEVIIAGLFQNQ